MCSDPDQENGGADLPTFRYPESAPSPRDQAIPEIDCDQVIAEVFTSGSTGLPVPHTKRWGSLVRNVRAEAERLGVNATHAILGTVPPQHMYGLESTVLMPLQSGAALHAGHPFYPADICAELAEIAAAPSAGDHALSICAPCSRIRRRCRRLTSCCRPRPRCRKTGREAEARFGAPLHGNLWLHRDRTDRLAPTCRRRPNGRLLPGSRSGPRWARRSGPRAATSRADCRWRRNRAAGAGPKWTLFCSTAATPTWSTSPASAPRWPTSTIS